MYRSMDVLCFISYVFIQCYSVHMPKGSFSVTGTMPPKKPTTRKSLRVPKLKEPEVGEGSSPAVAKQLDFSPKPVPVIKTSTKEVFAQPLAFGDTEVNIGTKTVFHAGKNFSRKSSGRNSLNIPRTMTPIQGSSTTKSS
jgi:hypothetical protein